MYALQNECFCLRNRSNKMGKSAQLAYQDEYSFFFFFQGKNKDETVTGKAGPIKTAFKNKKKVTKAKARARVVEFPLG